MSAPVLCPRRCRPPRPYPAARAARIAAGISTRALGRALHVDATLIGKVERGERGLAPELVVPWTKALGYPSTLAVRLFPSTQRRMLTPQELDAYEPIGGAAA